MPNMAPIPSPKASPFVWTALNLPYVKYGSTLRDGSHIWIEIQSPMTMPTTPQKIEEAINPFTVLSS